MHNEKLFQNGYFSLEHHSCEQVQRQEQGLRWFGLPTMKVVVQMHMPTKSTNVFFRDGIVPSDAHLQVELVDDETSDVVVGFPELFTIWSC